MQGKYKKPYLDFEARENLIVRTLCSKEVSKELVLRRSIFKKRCKIAKRCCKMIIDSRSSTNLASEELVTKL